MLLIFTTAAGAQGFHLLELSVGGKGTGSAGIDGGNMGDVEGGDTQNMVLLSVRGDGRVSIDGGGGVVVKDGDLEVSQGDASFKVLRAGKIAGSAIYSARTGLLVPYVDRHTSNLRGFRVVVHLRADNST